MTPDPRDELPRDVRPVTRLALGRKPSVEQDVDDEVAFHLEMTTRELEDRGWTTEAAREEARRRFGDTRRWSNAMTEEDRARDADERRAEWIGDLRQDLRYGVRSLARTSLFTTLAVLTLGLGIGANAAVFSVVKSVLLDALPFPEPDRLVRVHTRLLDGSVDRGPLSAALIEDIRERQRSFERVAAFRPPNDVVVSGDAEPFVAKMTWVEPAYFPLLGVPAALGRTFRDDDVADTARAVVLEHTAWQRMYGGDRGAVGKPVRINGIDRTIIGVLPRDYVSPAGAADFYLPMSPIRQMANPVNARRMHWFEGVARLRPGIQVDAAHRELGAIGTEIAREHPQYHGSSGLQAVSLRETMVGDTRTPLLVLLASAGLVLVITCANLAGALLSRTLSRRKEFAVRIALGAGRGRLVRQLLAESAVIAIAGGAAGLLLAWLGLTAMRGVALAALPDHAALRLDLGAVLVTTVVALLTGIAFGVAPAIAASRANVQGTLRDESRGASEGPRTRVLRGVLVAGQIALCVSLLAGAGLLTRSLLAMNASPLGFQPEGVLAVPVRLSGATYGSPAARFSLVERYEEQLRALPGVTAVAAAGQTPFRSTGRMAPVPEEIAEPTVESIMLLKEVTDEYFRAMGIPLRGGRSFTAEDHGEAPQVVILSARAAAQLFPGRDAVGARIRMGRDSEMPRATVVGVVGDVRNDPSLPEPEPTMYMSYRQATWNGPVFLLRTSGDPLSLVRPAREVLAGIDPALPIHDVTTLDALLSEGMAGRRLPVVLLAAFGGLALLLASVGVYAMFAAMSAAREREFGVRVALGSSPMQIAGLVLRQGGLWMAVGLAGGAFGVVLVSRLVRGLLYGVPPFDLVSLGVAAGMLLVCATLALLVPVRRATRVDPISTLR